MILVKKVNFQNSVGKPRSVELLCHILEHARGGHFHKKFRCFQVHDNRLRVRSNSFLLSPPLFLDPAARNVEETLLQAVRSRRIVRTKPHVGSGRECHTFHQFRKKSESGPLWRRRAERKPRRKTAEPRGQIRREERKLG